MTTEVGTPTEERILQLLHHLDIPQAHFAGRVPSDYTGLAATYPEVFSSLTLVCPVAVDPNMANSFASKLLVFNGDQGPSVQGVRNIMESVSDATLVTLREYSTVGWTDVVADRTDEIGSYMTQFLEKARSPEQGQKALPAEREGEVAGISYRIRGSGPPLVLLPLALAPSQWEPLLPILSQHYCTITLAGAELGPIGLLESRGLAAGYLGMVRNLIEEAELRPGESVLEVGCGSGVLDRWLASHTRGENRITGVDINSYFLREATALSKKEGLEGLIEFREGDAQALPFPDNSFEVTMAITVMEEVDAEQTMSEMVRVTKPGGRIAVVVRAVDMPMLVNLPLRSELRRKIEDPEHRSQWVGEHGCADASLYQRFHQAGLTQVKMFPQLPAFDSSATLFTQGTQTRLLTTLTQGEVREWQTARAEAEAEGTFFIAHPYHCAVGMKPS